MEGSLIPFVYERKPENAAGSGELLSAQILVVPDKRSEAERRSGTHTPREQFDED